MLKHYQVFYIYLHVHLCWLVVFFFFYSHFIFFSFFLFLFFTFLLLFFSFLQKVVPTSNEVSFLCGSHHEPQKVRALDLTDKQRRKHSITHIQTLAHSHTFDRILYTLYMVQTHTHTFTLGRRETVSHTPI